MLRGRRDQKSEQADGRGGKGAGEWETDIVQMFGCQTNHMFKYYSDKILTAANTRNSDSL